MFGFFKKRLLKGIIRRMIGYVDTIKFAAYSKLVLQLAKQHDKEQAGLIAAAVLNRLFGSEASPMHANISATLIDEVAADFLQNEDDDDLLNGIVMSLQTMITVEGDAGNMEAMYRVVDALQWVKPIISPPPEDPNPTNMEHIAAVLQSRYCEQLEQWLQREQ